MTESAQLFKGVHDIPVYTDILFNKPLRLWVAISLYGGAALTVVLTILTLDSGHARAMLICGLMLTGAAAGGAALMPRGRPTLRFRLRSAWRALRPTLASSASDPLLAPPRTVIGNLSFTAHGVYAHYLISGLPYYLQSTKRRIGVADRHQAPGPRNPRRDMGFRAVGAPKPTPTAARHAAWPPRQAALGRRLPSDGARHRRTKPPHPHLLAGDARRRRPRRAQPRRPSQPSYATG